MGNLGQVDHKMRVTITHSKLVSSHMGMLIKAVLLSKGDICEVGAGIYSTPILHWLCKERGKWLRTYESHEKWYLFAKKFQSRLHSIRKVDNWDAMDFKRKWGVVFIDHAPAERRGIDVINFKDTADYIVMHDSEAEKIYGYDKAFPYFKYRYDWIQGWPHTAVVSNFYPLESFGELL